MTTGVFTTIKVKNGIPLFFDQHKNRLFYNSRKLKIKTDSLLLEDIKKYLRKNNLTDCALRITISNKEIAIESRQLPASPSVKLITLLDKRDKFKIYKTTNRVINEQAKKLAEKNMADDALFVLDNNIIESTIANVFSLNDKGELVTPSLDGKGLNGITRQIIMKNTKVIEKNIPKNSTSPLVLVNCLRIQKVDYLNNQHLIDGEKLFTKIKLIVESAEKEYIKNFQ